MRTFLQIVAQIDELRGRQREITNIESPSEAELTELWRIEGQVTALEAEAREAHERELTMAANAQPVTITPGTPGLSFRDMPRGQEFDIQAALAEGSGDGQYLVGQEWHNQVEEYRMARAWFRGLNPMLVRTASTHNIPVLDGLATAAITGENAAYTDSDPSIANVILYAYKLTLKSNVSEELIDDTSYNVDAFLARATGLGFGSGEQKLFIVGNGSGQPTGVMNKTADKTFASATAITKDELIEVVYGLARHYRDGACWMMNDATAAYIAKLKLDVTTSGTTPYFWTDSVGGEPPKLLGYPVYTDANIATIASAAKTICFGNVPMYVIGERGPMKAKRLQLNEYSDTFAFAHRIDGKPLDPAAFYVAKQLT